MEKQFFEVFPTLKLDKKIQDLFEQVRVEKVSATKKLILKWKKNSKSSFFPPILSG